MADERLRATPEQLCDALGACTELNAVYRRLLYNEFLALQQDLLLKMLQAVELACTALAVPLQLRVPKARKGLIVQKRRPTGPGATVTSKTVAGSDSAVS